ncbi:DRTGG domain-containing protein [Candidatus Auribacterota bacterium]
MKTLFIGSIVEYSGKNLLSLGVGKHYIEKNLNVGYFKPLGISPVEKGDDVVDADAMFFQNEMALKDKLSDICPVMLTSEYVNDIYSGTKVNVEGKIQSAYKRVSENKDLMIVSGFGNISCGCLIDASQVDTMRKFDCKVIIIDRYAYNEREMVDGFIWMKETLGDKLLGVVFNKIPQSKKEFFTSKVVPFLRKKGIDTVGILPDDPVLHSLPVRDIVEFLHGRLVCCEEQIDNLCERICVGAMNVTSALKYFKNIHNKVVITGGDRGDIQLAALETSTRCLILTGDLQPHNNIIMTAMAKKVPIVVVPYDTLTTVDKFEMVLGHLSLRGDKKVEAAVNVVSECIDFGMIDKYVMGK